MYFCLSLSGSICSSFEYILSSGVILNLAGEEVSLMSAFKMLTHLSGIVFNFGVFLSPIRCIC